MLRVFVEVMNGMEPPVHGEQDHAQAMDTFSSMLQPTDDTGKSVYTTEFVNVGALRSSTRSISISLTH